MPLKINLNSTRYHLPSLTVSLTFKTHTCNILNMLNTAWLFLTQCHDDTQWTAQWACQGPRISRCSKAPCFLCVSWFNTIMGIGMVYVLSIPPAVLVCQDLWTLLANKHNSGSDIFLHFKCIINYAFKPTSKSGARWFWAKEPIHKGYEGQGVNGGSAA